MTPGASDDRPERPLELVELLAQTWALLRGRPGVLLALSVLFVVPVELIVSGVGLEHLTAAYRTKPTLAETLLPAAVRFVVITPLITAAAIDVIAVQEAGERPSVRGSLQASLDMFAPLFAAVLLAATAIVLGFFAFIVPGIYLAVRFFFVPQTFVLERARWTDAAQASWDLTDHAWWRTFGVIILANLIVAIPTIVIMTPLDALAKDVDLQVVSFGGSMLIDVFTAPFLAVLSTVLYWDLQVRRRRRASAAA